jgi:hypothetical protein
MPAQNTWLASMMRPINAAFDIETMFDGLPPMVPR